MVWTEQGLMSDIQTKVYRIPGSDLEGLGSTFQVGL